MLEGRPRGTMKGGEQSQCLLPVELGWGEWENIFHKLDMTGHKDFFKSMVKIEEGTLSKGVAEKDTWTRFGVKFVERVETQLGKT